MIYILSHWTWNIFLIFSISIHYISQSLINFILLFFLNIFLNILIWLMFGFNVSAGQSHENSICFSAKSLIFLIIFVIQFSFYYFTKFVYCVKVCVSLVYFCGIKYFKFIFNIFLYIMFRIWIYLWLFELFNW